MKVTFKQKNLRAVARAMGDNDIRYYLNGVKIEYNGREVRLIATDGHRLHAAIEDRGEDLIEPITFIMPDEMVKTCCKAKFHKFDRTQEIMLDFNNGEIKATLPGGIEVTGREIDGKFPDYHRVIPSSTSFTLAPSHYQPDYVVDAFNSLREYLEISKDKHPGVAIAQRGMESGVLSVPGFTVIIMPMRIDTTAAADIRMGRCIEYPQSVAVQ